MSKQIALPQADMRAGDGFDSLLVHAGIAQPYLEGTHAQRIAAWQKYIATNLSGETDISIDPKFALHSAIVEVTLAHNDVAWQGTSQASLPAFQMQYAHCS